MVIDFIIILIFTFFVIIGFRRGFWLSLIHFSATIVSLWIANQFYKSIVERLIVFIPYPKTAAFSTKFAFHFNHLQFRFEAIVAFLLIALLCKFILYLIIVTFDKIVAYQNIHIFSRAMGMVVGVLMAILLLNFTLYLLALYPNEALQHQLKISIVSHSLIYHIPYLSAFTINL
ncbi:CvpA family protein [Staphylococcus argenteus]|uniref:CvpA family protein n=1 Tax=Staphylococcus argenteus TaxID=985002 RepID=UPI0005023779|nr:CvpA family protein [Staphylococcus argenteus]CDR20007.1 Colicin V production protein [Staphylococcus argenteus]